MAVSRHRVLPSALRTVITGEPAQPAGTSRVCLPRPRARRPCSGGTSSSCVPDCRANAATGSVCRQGTRPGTLIVFVAVEAGLLSRGKESQGNGMWIVHDAQASPGQAARGMVTMAPCSVQGPRCVPPRPEQRLPVTAERMARAWPRAWFVNKQTRHSHAPQPLSPAPSLTRHSPACHVLVTHGRGSVCGSARSGRSAVRCRFSQYAVFEGANPRARNQACVPAAVRTVRAMAQCTQEASRRERT